MSDKPSYNVIICILISAVQHILVHVHLHNTCTYMCTSQLTPLRLHMCMYSNLALLQCCVHASATPLPKQNMDGVMEGNGFWAGSGPVAVSKLLNSPHSHGHIILYQREICTESFLSQHNYKLC